MMILDRYIIRYFLICFVILAVVLIGLVELLDFIINVDEFTKQAEASELEGWAWVRHIAGLAAGFYGPMAFLIYGYLAGLLPVAAAAFTLADLMRKRELVAMLAGGVSMHRIAMPIVVLGFAANLLMLANQEFILPVMAHRLSQGHNALRAESATIRLRFVPDGSGRLFTAAGFDPQTQTMRDLTVLVRQQAGESYYGRAVDKISATAAVWDEQRGGWALSDGQSSGDPESLADAVGALGSPRSVDFIVSDLDPPSIMLREHSRYSQLLSLRQLAQLIEKPQVVDVNELKRIRHSRFSVLIVNMLILLMGLAFYLIRVPGNLLAQTVKAAPLCVGAWAGGFVMLQIPVASVPPAAVAWMPVALYLPLAWYLMDGVET